MAKQRVGLHKEITSIFDGVPIRKHTGVQEAPGAPPVAPDSYKEHFKPGERRFDRPDSTGQPTPAPKKPKAPGHRQTKPSLPKFAAAESPRADAATKSVVRIPWRNIWEQVKKKLFASTKEGVNIGRQKIMVVLVPLLLIVLLSLSFRVLLPSGSTTENAAKPGLLNAAVGSDGKINWQAPEPYPATLRDPMRFSAVATAQAGTETGGLKVRGIVHSKDRPSAIVGNKIVHVGDHVSGVTVTNINKDSVEFEKNGKKWMQKVE